MPPKAYDDDDQQLVGWIEAEGVIRRLSPFNKSGRSHIARWPASARRTANHPGIRVVPLGRYPTKIFDRVADDTVEILHIHHAARQPWDESPPKI